MADALTRRLAETGALVHAAVQQEVLRQQDTREMIASEKLAPAAKSPLCPNLSSDPIEAA